MQAKSGNPADPVRERLVEGLAAAVAQDGYGAVTIAEIVRHARVSKRTFYEHFTDKDECFLAAYAEASVQILEAIASAIDPRAPWERQVRSAVRAYLGALESRPTLARTFLFEIQAAGPRALKARRRVHERFAEQIRGFVEDARRHRPSLRPLKPAIAAALVGGLNELVLLHLEAGGHHFGELAPTACEFVFAVLGA